jgi:glycerol-3-phosphate acyltransferase PlsY
MGAAFIWQLIVIAMVGYLIGSVNLSIILSHLMGKGDIRNYGSGNAGTTNTLRTLGKLPALAVLLFDIFKGVIAIFLGKWLMGLGIMNVEIEYMQLAIEYAELVAGFFAIIGHNYPIYYGFKGGKGIATSLGVILTIEPIIGGTCALFAVVLILASRMVSLGSIFAAFLYPVLVFTLGEAYPTEMMYKIPYCAFALLLGVLAIYRHRANIDRLLNGTENKLWKTKKEKAELAAKEETKESAKTEGGN